MTQPDVWVLGGYQSDFARNLHREGKDFADLAAEVVEGTLAAACVDAEQIGVIHVGNAFGQLFAGQGHLGAMPATVHQGPSSASPPWRPGPAAPPRATATWSRSPRT